MGGRGGGAEVIEARGGAAAVVPLQEYGGRLFHRARTRETGIVVQRRAAGELAAGRPADQVEGMDPDEGDRAAIASGVALPLRAVASPVRLLRRRQQRLPD